MAQLSGYVAEHSAYHHGEVSLQGTITSMAQNYVGSNNINLLLPNGQFGTRAQGGKDAASARYVFTALSPVTRTVFPEADDAVLEYQVEEGQSIEPTHYLPIIPMVLVNGAEGIGTGWSTSIPQYDPRKVAANVRNLMAGRPFVPMDPWYKGWDGEIVENGPDRYDVHGTYEIDGDQCEITELPIGKWTQDYKKFLEELIESGDLEDVTEHHAENRVSFVLVGDMDALEQKARSKGGLEKFLKLKSSIASTNLVLFDHESKIYKYKSAEDIMKAWFDLRQDLYEKRKAYQLRKLLMELQALENKVRFIKCVIEEEIQIKRVRRRTIVDQLQEMKFLTKSQLDAILAEPRRAIVVQDQPNSQSDPEEEDGEDEADPGVLRISEYDYLLGMPLWSLSEEKVAELNRAASDKKDEHKDLEAIHIHTLWERDLEAFENTLEEHEQQEEEDRSATDIKNGKGGPPGDKKGSRAAKQKAKKPRPSQREKQGHSKSPKPQKKEDKKARTKSPKPSSGSGNKPKK